MLAVATALDQWTTIQCPSFLILALSSDHISEKNVGQIWSKLFFNNSFQQQLKQLMLQITPETNNVFKLRLV